MESSATRKRRSRYCTILLDTGLDLYTVQPMPLYRDIKPFVRDAVYHVTVCWDYLPKWLDSLKERIGEDERTVTYDGLILCPDFQRGHVWTPKQQIAYVEYIMRAGASGKTIYLNNPSWGKGYNEPTVVVDGLQRITAVQAFLNGEIKAFGHAVSEWKGRIEPHCHFDAYVHNLSTRREVLEWYIGLNAGGTPHNPSEIARVRALLKVEPAST